MVISHQSPERVLVLVENQDLKDKDFTPWNVSVSAIPKPPAFAGERLDLNDLSSSYFIYVCRMDPELLKKRAYRDERWAAKQKDRTGRRKWKNAPPL